MPWVTSKTDPRVREWRDDDSVRRGASSKADDLGVRRSDGRLTELAAVFDDPGLRIRERGGQVDDSDPLDDLDGERERARRRLERG